MTWMSTRPAQPKPGCSCDCGPNGCLLIPLRVFVTKRHIANPGYRGFPIVVLIQLIDLHEGLRAKLWPYGNEHAPTDSQLFQEGGRQVGSSRTHMDEMIRASRWIAQATVAFHDFDDPLLPKFGLSLCNM